MCYVPYPCVFSTMERDTYHHLINPEMQRRKRSVLAGLKSYQGGRDNELQRPRVPLKMEVAKSQSNVTAACDELVATRLSWKRRKTRENVHRRKRKRFVFLRNFAVRLEQKHFFFFFFVQNLLELSHWATFSRLVVVLFVLPVRSV